MYISELKVENFRLFGEGENAALLRLWPGLTAIVGENDSGKTVIVDALRLALGARDQEYFRIDDDDFNCSTERGQSKQIRIRCRFAGLTRSDTGAFADYLTYEDVIYLNWKALATEWRARHRRYVSVEVRSGIDADRPVFDPESRNLLCATYLRPLRDAERALSAGRGSRLSQILQYTDDIAKVGVPYDHAAGPPADPATLSILGIGDFANALLKGHVGLTGARDLLNEDYLKNLSFAGSDLSGDIGVATGDEAARLRQLLEKLELQLQEAGADHLPRNRGLGSNNLLFMACELLLLGSEEEGFPFLLIEEPEAHLHPQRQLRLMRFLEDKAQPVGGDHDIQILVTTHSPNFASAIDLDNLLLLQGGKAFSLASGETNLSPSDYRFLQRFLDVTKANLFFARGVIIVEGDAENILVPTIAGLIDRDLTESGVSIVNVGGTGFRRYARIFQRKNPADGGEIGIPLACIADTDVMPDCAPEIIGKVRAGEDWPEGRRWMRRYFDAHVYVANWCTCILCLRLPKSAFDAGTLRDFTTETTFSFKQTKTHWLIEWVLDESENYERFAEEDDRGWIGRLAPLRDDFRRGDMRPLYLGWLAGVSAGEISEKSAEPQPPPGLSRLTAAQQSLAEFLEIDENLLAAAGLADPPGAKTGSEGDAELDAWLATLPEVEKNAMLKLSLTGHVQ